MSTYSDRGNNTVLPAILRKVPLSQYPWFLNIQFINLLIPLISYPYLLRVIGPEKYGLIAVANSIGAILVTLTEYGISFIGIRDVSRISDEVEKVSQYFSKAIVIRALIFALCVIVIVPVILGVPILQRHAILFILTIVAIFPGMMFPQWLYIGIQKIRQYNYILLLSKALSVALVFILITAESDYAIFPLVNLIPACIVVWVNLLYLKKIGIRLRVISIEHVWDHLRSEFYPFISQSLTSLYVQINPILLLALLHDAAMVGYYAVAEKIVLLFKSLFSPFNQLFLPDISNQFVHSPAKAMSNVKQYSAVIGVINFAGMTVLILSAKQVIMLFAGEHFMNSVSAIQLLSPMMLFVALNNLAGVHVMLNLEMKREFFIGIIAGVFANIALLIVLVPHFSYVSPAVSWTISEGIVLGIFVLYLRKKIQGNGK